jgi:flagellar biosynthesis/type III secretory pathway protein FliH
MTQKMKLSLTRPLKGLRPHRVPVEETAGPGEGAKWIFALRERAGKEARHRAAVQNCMDGIDRAVESITTSVDRRLDDVAALATELGLALAREILGAALEKGLADPTATVSRCLRESAVGTDGEIAVFLSPDDLDLVIDELDRQADPPERVARSRFAADPELDRGSVRIETAAGRLLYDPAEVLQRICDEVRQELAG